MTHDEWKAEFDRIVLHLVNDRGLSPRLAAKRARIKMQHRYGRQPKKPRLPLRLRLTLWWVGRKLKGTKPVEVKMSHVWQKVVVSLMYGIGALGAVVSVALQDGSISGAEWMSMLSAFVAAAWGKFSSNTTVIAPSRKGETIAGPH
jgi:hypothetical protein